jgi:quinol-cytochrome oxidoreductase complex cytochrome b subunit
MNSEKENESNKKSLNHYLNEWQIVNRISLSILFFLPLSICLLTPTIHTLYPNNEFLLKKYGKKIENIWYLLLKHIKLIFIVERGLKHKSDW